MAIGVGSRVGPYEITALLGEGGMGKVWRAHHTALKRDDALKVLPDAFASDRDRLARFQREAQVLASLNHPNIAHVYGLEQAESVQALVMELVQGPTLADRIAQGPIPVDEALAIAKQIAEALEAAHEQSIIHRDLKPGNIKVRSDGTVKVLDFGLAKALEPISARVDATASPTITSPAMMTGVGMLLGTAAYMSPEQARGKPVDKRSDIWAFGCVLYEMLTGKRAFEGEEASDTLAAVLRSEPDWVALPADLPTGLHTMLRRCLAKDRKRRIGDVAVVQYVLSEPALTSGSGSTLAAASAVPTPPPWRRAIPIVAATFVGAAVTGGITWTSRPPTSLAQVARLSFLPPEDQRFVNQIPQVVGISRDGTQMAYAANLQLYLRTIRDSEPKPIPGTGEAGGTGVASIPVFSPDGQSIVFHSFAMGALRRIPVSGGTAVTICPADLPTGLSWSDDGIVFGQGAKGIMRVSPNGGNPELLVSVETGEFAQSPQILPGGRAVLFTLARGNTTIDEWDMARIVAQSLETGERKVLVEGGSDARYVPTGHIVYAVGGAILAVPFDVANLQVTGGPVPVIEGVRRTTAGLGTGGAFFSFSDTGSVIYVPGPVDISGLRRSMLVADQKGGVELLPIPPGPYEHPRVSPDGRRIAFGTDDGKEATVWIYDLAGTTAMRRLTFGGRNRFPIWTADGQRLAFQSDRDGDLGIFWQRADGAGTAERLTKADQGTSHVPESWSPKSETLLFSVVKESNAALWALPMGTKKAEVFGDVRSVNPITAVFSPDGRWVAYHSGEIGADAVYVQPFPATGAKYQIAKIAATQLDHHPVWSRDGTKLFYIPNLGTLAAVSVTTEPTFSFGNTLPISRKFTELSSQFNLRNYDITPDGKVIGLVASEGSESAFAPVEFRVVLNWFEELKRLVPTR